MSKILNYSTATISHIENSKDLLHNEKLDIYLKSFNLNSATLIAFDTKIYDIFNGFIRAIEYIEEDKVKEFFENIINYIAPYKGTVLYSVNYLVNFIYCMFHKVSKFSSKFNKLLFYFFILIIYRNNIIMCLI